MYSVQDCFDMMGDPEYYGKGHRENDYSRPWHRAPRAPRRTKAELDEIGRKIEKVLEEHRQSYTVFLEDLKREMFRQAECVPPENAEQLAAEVAAILRELDHE